MPLWLFYVPAVSEAGLVLFAYLVVLWFRIRGFKSWDTLFDWIFEFSTIFNQNSVGRFLRFVILAIYWKSQGWRGSRFESLIEIRLKFILQVNIFHHLHLFIFDVCLPLRPRFHLGAELFEIQFVIENDFCFIYQNNFIIWDIYIFDSLHYQIDILQWKRAALLLHDLHRPLNKTGLLPTIPTSLNKIRRNVAHFLKDLYKVIFGYFQWI